MHVLRSSISDAIYSNYIVKHLLITYVPCILYYTGQYTVIQTSSTPYSFSYSIPY